MVLEAGSNVTTAGAARHEVRPTHPLDQSGFGRSSLTSARCRVSQRQRLRSLTGLDGLWARRCTGTLARRTTSSETLPRMRRPSGPRPWLPSTMMSTSFGGRGLEDRIGRIPFPDRGRRPADHGCGRGGPAPGRPTRDVRGPGRSGSKPAARQLGVPLGRSRSRSASSACDRAARSNASSVAADDAADSSVARSTVRRRETPAPFGPIASSVESPTPLAMGHPALEPLPTTPTAPGPAVRSVSDVASLTTRAVTIPYIPSIPSACGRM